MNWKDLESLIHDNYAVIPADRAEELSKQLLAELDEGAKPLQGAKIAYTLVLIQLKSEQGSSDKALKFLQYLDTILKHEVKETTEHEHDHSEGHLAYVLKLADHYLHHIAVVAELKEAAQLKKRALRLRGRYHELLTDLHGSKRHFAKEEQTRVKRTLSSHFVAMGLVLALATFFSWTSFWELSDYAAAQWVFSESNPESTSDIVLQGFLLVFGLVTLLSLLRYALSPEKR